MPNNELQIENGNYTRIVNRVLEELSKAPLLGAELAICIFVIRKTYGYNKKEDGISLTQFEEGTSRSRPTIVKALKQLQLVNILKLVKKGDSKKQSNIWIFNKYYDTWKLVNKPKLVKKTRVTSKEIHDKLVNTALHTKENTKNTKDIGESGEEPIRAYAPGIHEMILWAESRMGHRFPDKPKQAGALAKIFAAKYRPEQVRECWENLERDEYWGVQGFDFRAVVSEIGKARGSQEIYSLVRKK